MHVRHPKVEEVESLDPSESSISSVSSVSSPSEGSQVCLPPEPSGPECFGRYVLHAPIARGGMATIYIARLIGAEGFSRIVAAKRLYPHFTEDPEFVTMFHDEARIASKIHHPNVVPVLDVVRAGSEVILVQEYVHGVPLDKLFKAALLTPERPIPVGIAVAIVAGVLAGLHAAHETRDEMDEPLEIVHRDVSPQNVMVSVDGIPRLLDFGIAKAQSSAHVTRDGFFKGKVAYMAPEQLRAEAVTRTADIYAAGVLLWELLVHRRLHTGRGEAQLFSAVLTGAIPTIGAAVQEARETMSELRWQQLADLDPIVQKALANNPAHRFATAAQMLEALLSTCAGASSREVGAWVRTLGEGYLDRRQQVLTSHAESWRSQSKISAAPPADSVLPASGVKLRRDRIFLPVERSSPSVIELSRVDLVDERSAIPSFRVAASPSGPAPRGVVREGLVAATPWLLAAGLLLLCGILLGVLGARANKHDAEAASARTVGAPAAFELPASPSSVAAANGDVPGQSASNGGAIALGNTNTLGNTNLAAAARALHASPPPVVSAAAPPPATPRWTPPSRAAAPAQVHAASPSPQQDKSPAASVAASASSATVSSSPKADCNPPFYFDGTKKLFKAGCL